MLELRTGLLPSPIFENVRRTIARGLLARYGQIYWQGGLSDHSQTN